MNDPRAYSLLAGFYIYQEITKQVEHELESDRPTSLTLKAAIALGMKDDDTPASPVEWHSVSADFAKHAKQLNEVIACIPGAFAWGRQTSDTPVHEDRTAQKIIDILNK